jgi:hypothetical protein
VKHRALPQQQLADPLTEEVRRTHAQAIDALQRDLNERAAVVIENVSLPNATDVTIAHKLGRAPRFIAVSVVRGAAAAGYINEIRGSTDRSKLIVLRATGFGATITADVRVGSE